MKAFILEITAIGNLLFSLFYYLIERDAEASMYHLVWAFFLLVLVDQRRKDTQREKRK